MTARKVKSETAPVYGDTDDAAIIERAKAILYRDMQRGEAMSNPDSAAMYCAAQLKGRESEAFGVLFMDTRHRVLAWEILFTGTIDGAEVHPREVAKRALHHNAAAIILAHNHPSGDSTPSAADRAVTARLKQSLALVDVRVLDHFIVGDGRPTSMAALGWV